MKLIRSKYFRNILRVSERELKERIRNHHGKPRNQTYNEKAYKRDRAERKALARFKMREAQKRFSFPEIEQKELE